MRASLLLATLLSPSLCFSDLSITFSSQHKSAIDVSWVDADGHEVPMGELLPGTELSFKNVGEGHTFRARNQMTQKTVTRVARQNENNFFLLSPETDDSHSVHVICSLKRGDAIRIDVFPEWSPRGAARFLELVRRGFFDGVALTRVVPRFLTQFGVGTTPEDRALYSSPGSAIEDDAPSSRAPPFAPGMLAYAGSGPNSRSSEMFFVMPDAPAHQLKAFGTNPWETPFGRVSDAASLAVVGSFFSYGDMPPWGKGPDPNRLNAEGYGYLAAEFPRLDYLAQCRIFDDDDGEEL